MLSLTDDHVLSIDPVVIATFFKHLTQPQIALYRTGPFVPAGSNAGDIWFYALDRSGVLRAGALIDGGLNGSDDGDPSHAWGALDLAVWDGLAGVHRVVGPNFYVTGPSTGLPYFAPSEPSLWDLGMAEAKFRSVHADAHYRHVVGVQADYTCNAGAVRDHTVYASGTTTVTLPDATSNKGQEIEIISTDGSHTVTIATAGTDTIADQALGGGLTALTMANRLWGSYRLVSVGAGIWITIAKM